MVLLDLGPGPATPPWLPLLMVVVLLALIGFLYWSMRRNLNRIDFDESRRRRGTDHAGLTGIAAGVRARAPDLCCRV